VQTKEEFFASREAEMKRKVATEKKAADEATPSTIIVSNSSDLDSDFWNGNRNIILCWFPGAGLGLGLL
jgi:hypothetical protein